MPTYTYYCKNHGEFEEFHSIKDQLNECPHCKKEGISQEVKRLIAGGGGFILTGGGWAREGYS